MSYSLPDSPVTKLLTLFHRFVVPVPLGDFSQGSQLFRVTKWHKNVPTSYMPFDHCHFRSNCTKNHHNLKPQSRRAVGHCTFCLAVAGFQHSAASMTKKDGFGESPWLLHTDLAALREALTGRRLSGSSWLSPRPHLLQIIGSLPGQSPRNPSLQAWFLLLAQGGRAQSTALTHPWPEDGLHILSSCFIFSQSFWLGVCASLSTYASNWHNQITESFL